MVATDLSKTNFAVSSDLTPEIRENWMQIQQIIRDLEQRLRDLEARIKALEP